MNTERAGKEMAWYAVKNYSVQRKKIIYVSFSFKSHSSLPQYKI